MKTKTTKRRRIRWDRVLFLVSVAILIGAIIGYTVCSIIYNNFKKEITPDNRPYEYMSLTSPDYVEELNYIVWEEEVEEEVSVVTT